MSRISEVDLPPSFVYLDEEEPTRLRLLLVLLREQAGRLRSEAERVAKRAAPLWERLSPARRLAGGTGKPLFLAVACVATALAGYSLLAPARNSSRRLPVVITNAATPQVPAPVLPQVDVPVATEWERLEPAARSYTFQINNDGTLLAAKQSVSLYGIAVLPRNKLCTYRNGARWACGQRAYIALLNILGSASVDCRPHDTERPNIVICKLAGSDISELMLREGWATPESGATSRYIDAAASASLHQTGMWTPQPPQRGTAN